MRCPSCGMNNPMGMQFCGACGALLQQTGRRCPRCGFEQNPPAFLYCGQCGAPLAEETHAAAWHDPSVPVSLTPKAERRQLTVMFCDLVGSTALSEALDAEDLRTVVQAYQTASVGVVERFGGYVAQYLGDGILVYFGYPAAHEDEAERAARAGLDLIREIEQLSTQLKLTMHVELAVRVGIHTGVVVVGEVGSGRRREQLALGRTPNVAARLQELAAPNTVVVSSATHRLIEEVFACEDLGPQFMKGVSEAESVYRVLGAHPTRRSVLDVTGPGGQALIGRTQELELLEDRWTAARQGGGQVVSICGEPGMGKTHLIQVFKQRLDGQPHTCLECRCLPYYQHSAFYPFVDLLLRRLRLDEVPTPAERLERLAAFLEGYGLPASENVPLFAVLLSVPVSAPYASFPDSPQVMKEKTRSALVHLLVRLAEASPLVLMVEDAHWADPSTLDLLGVLIDQRQGASLLLLVTFDASFRPPWPPRAHLTQLTLPRLPRHQVELLIAQITGGKVLPPEVQHQIISRTDGVPLFVEELTKMVLESELLREQDDRYELRGPLPPLAIPATLHDSLMARLDRLSTVKAVAQLAATIGREFSYALLRAVSLLDEATLQRELDRLVEAELLYQRGRPPHATYFFKHALIQEEAYQSLLKSTQQQYHSRIAQVLKTQFAEAVTAHPELPAHHYTAAGLNDQAVPFWKRAGEKAMQQWAYQEAITHFKKALELLRDLPDDPQRTERELALNVDLGVALRAVKGFAAPEVEQVYERARVLCGQVGETPHLFAVRRGLWAFHLLRAQYDLASRLGEQLLALARRLDDSAFMLEARVALGFASCWMGKLTQARTHLEEGLALYDPKRHRVHAYRYGQDPGVAGRSILAYVLWLLGESEAAVEQSREALELAGAVAHPFSLAYALQHAILIAQARQDVEAVQEQAGVLIALAREQGFAFWLASGTIFHGWALARQGREKEGLAQIRQGLDAYQGTGARLASTVWMALLAEACGLNGQPEEGLDLLDEVLAQTTQTGERIWEAELHRLKGQLLLGQDQRVEAEACFRQALDVARQLHAVFWEHRAAASLEVLLEQQDISAQTTEV